jgi:predicted DNA-binding ribbon-helix-helix protein
MCKIFAGQKRSNYQYTTRSIRLNGQCTSVRLEYKFWSILDEIAESESLSTPQFISKMHTEVMALHGETHNFASLLRCACLIYLEHQAEAAPA